MARWTPTDKVTSNEHIGRRLFNEPMLRGVTDQPSFSGINLNHFLDNRDGEFSVDRLGKSSVDGKVLRYLQPKAIAHGQSMKSTFDGWAFVAAKNIQAPPKGRAMELVASPVVESKNEPENLYHAHIVIPADADDYDIGLHLRHIFTTYGKIHRVADAAAPSGFWAKLLALWCAPRLTGHPAWWVKH